MKHKMFLPMFGSGPIFLLDLSMPLWVVRGCPAFHFKDFEMGDKEKMLKEFSNSEEMIKKL